jgi:hypothetical protein
MDKRVERANISSDTGNIYPEVAVFHERHIPCEVSVLTVPTAQQINGSTDQRNKSTATMPPCLYICCHFEITDDHNDSPSRPRATSKAIQEDRHISRRTSHRYSSRENHRARERSRVDRSRADRQRHYSRHRSQASSVSLSPEHDHYLELTVISENSLRSCTLEPRY